MKILRVVLVLFIISAFAAMVMHSQEQPQELSSFSANPASIQPEVMTTFSFVFNVPMDTTVSAYVHFKMTDDNDLVFPAYWDGKYKCKVSYSFPNANDSGTAEIILTGARTQDGKDVGDIHESVKVIPSSNPNNRM